ncbi:MAG: SCO family protein [Paracoccaceae bacterium]
MKRNELYFTVFAATAVSILAGVAWMATRVSTDGKFASCTSGSVAGGTAAIGGAFTLTDEAGLTVTDVDVFERPALVYFGYTFCPDVCPLDVARNADAVDLLAARGLDIRPVFITIDPERDTPEVLTEYTNFMHPDMLGLTGTPDQIKAASQTYKTYYKKQPSEDEFYLMDHSTFSYLILPETGFASFFRRDDTAEEIADSAACFLEQLG